MNYAMAGIFSGCDNRLYGPKPPGSLITETKVMTPSINASVSGYDYYEKMLRHDLLGMERGRKPVKKGGCLTMLVVFAILAIALVSFAA